MTELLAPDEAAQMFACSKAAVRKWAAQGRLPKVKVGRLTRFRRTDLEAVIANGLPSTGRQRHKVS